MKSYVINLNRRPDRWVVVREELNSHGFNLTRFSAIDTKPGWRGCAASHLAIMEECKNEVAFFVWEDDVQFIYDKETTNLVLNKALQQIPSDWDCLFLGASPQEPQERYSDNLFRLKNAFCTHSILWHNREGGAMEYILKNRDKINKIDVFFSQEIFPIFNCYLVFPLLCSQHQTQSDCCKVSDLSTIAKNYAKYCK
jgi:GR25 family glycosyltransferase involved in LPS biosynthesis